MIMTIFLIMSYSSIISAKHQNLVSIFKTAKYCFTYCVHIALFYTLLRSIHQFIFR